MSIEFLKAAGFEQDPFASTNATDEPLIEEYFVQPPFFPAVVGDPKHPKSNVVFAPRGGGKTAQKIMIEKYSQENPTFVCISYDRFPTEGLKAAKDATSDYHLLNISRAVLIACLVNIQKDDKKILPKLESHDRILLVQLSRNLLGSISSEQFKEAVASIKSTSDKVQDAYNKYGGLVTTLINAVSSKFGIGKLDKFDIANQKLDESIRFKFDNLIALTKKMGADSVYILVDRVDELTLTSKDAERGFRFLESILIDLPLLETPGAAFKFFLWDQTKSHYQDAGGRSDRLLEYTLDWSEAELDTVLTKRLETYSKKKISKLDQIVDDDSPYNIHRLVSYFANGSPRDMVRICKRIVDEHTKLGKYDKLVPFRTVKAAISLFSIERAAELYGESIRELRKVDTLTFTINMLANDVFRITTQAARAKVQNWQLSGAIVRIGDVPNPGNRPLYLYGIRDPRLALAVLSDASIEELLEEFLVLCPHCRKLRVATDGEITCPSCQGTFEANDAEKLHDVLLR